MILSEYRGPKKTTNKKIKPLEQLIVLSAKSEKALEEMTGNFLNHISGLHQDTSDFLQRAAFTLQTGREDFIYRRFAIGNNKYELRKSFVKNPIKHCTKNDDVNIVFMFPGQGTQYPQMAQELMQIPYFAKLVIAGAKLASKYLNCDFLSLLQSENPEKLNETQYSQPALFIIEYALAKLLIHYGIKPHALIGHSLGEYVAACLSGVFSYEDGVILVCERGILMSKAPRGAMLTIECSINYFKEIHEFLRTIELALHNSNQHCVVSGSINDIEELEKYLKDKNISYQRLNVSHAFHSRLMEPIKDSFIDMLSNINFNTPSIPIVSNLTGDWLSTKDAMDVDYWYQHLRNTVKLNDGLSLLAKDGNSFFIEIGPKRSLSFFLKSILKNYPEHTHTINHTLSPSKDLQQLLSLIGLCWMKSINIQWNQLHHNFLDQKIYLPTYSFQKQRYWLDPDSKFLYKNKPQIYAPSWSYQPISIISQQTMELKSHLNNNLIIFLSPNEFSNNFLSILKKMGITPNIIEANSIFYKKEPNYYLIDPGNKKHYSLAFENIKFDSETIIIHLFSSITYEADIQNENEIEHELNLSFYSFLYGLQAYVESDLASTSLKYALITTGTYKIIGNETIHPVNASLLGAMRVAQLEHTNFKFKFFDLELTGLSEKSDTYISSIIDSCLYGHWGNNTPIVAYRHLSQYELDYVPIKNSKIMSRFSENGVYLITGGLGGVAFYLCKAIASRVKNPTFILVSRTPIIEPSQWPSILSYPSHVDYTKINRLKTLESLGATVYWDAIDITDLESVTQLVNQYKTRCNGINGVIHAAGIAGDGLLQFKSKTKSEPIFKSKLFSAYILARALEGLELDFVVLMSSIAALTGEIGQIDYSAANASLDALAVSNLFSSKFTVSINWNTWKNIGMAADSKRPIDVNYTERGNYISPKQGEKLFFKIMENTYSNVAISNYGLEQYRLNLIQGDKHSLEPNIKTQREQLNISTDYNEPQNSTEKKLVQLWQDNLGIDRIGIYDDFFAMGGHSLKALKLIDTINKIFNSKISIQHLYKHPTIYELAKHIDFNNNVDIGIVVSLKKAQTKAPTIFCCHPISGMIYCFESLISNWQTPINIYGLQDPSISCDILKYKNIISMAKSYLKAIKEIQPKGPYNFLGYSFGGTLLYEIGHLLQKNNEKVNLLALIDGWCVFSDKQKNEDYFKKEFKISHKNLSDNLINLSWARMKLLFKHIPTKTNQDLILFKATELLNDYKTIDHPSNGWSNHTTGKILNYEIKANHHTIINKENILNIIKILDL